MNTHTELQLQSSAKAEIQDLTVCSVVNGVKNVAPWPWL